ncbi:NADH-ubiquinone oxidoreductase-F iron-sulfur binding region domain-containing protein [Halococcus salsus]|uniref:NADH-ubiquinone oxidoreductase-F iron-sulfur binding region domain-containing protein n=1 Tax=Halococcus salsus TaxID=2162894 RepID=UPI001357C3F7|nr:NADH-ubiquinone oxidoreductase-F iron-sulfur binding region domain-containing protein [Halococcus salsus]
MMVDDGVRGRDPAVRVAGAGNDSRSDELLAAGRDPETTVAVAAVGSTGIAGLEPLVLATLDGETAFFSGMDTDGVRALVESLDEGTLPTDDAMAVVEHDPETASLPLPDDGPLAVGRRAALSGVGWTNPTSTDDYRAGEFLASETTDDAMERLRETGLRGRGRGDVATDTPVVEEWATVAETDGDAVVVVNANEADPDAEADRLLLESAPFSVLDPAFAAARAVDATDLVVYVNEREHLARERAKTAAEALDGTVDGLSTRIVAGPDEYKAGEPTVVLEAIEGNHRLEARRTPPGPSEYGVDGRPTLVHTPRTFAQVGRALAGEDLGGVASDPGTRLVTVTGDVASPATVELSTDDGLDSALSAVEAGGRSMACVGGVFGGLTRTLDVPANASGLTGAQLGTNGVVELLDESTCPVAFAGERATFAKEENCGRCVPGREGSKQLVNLLRDVYDGEYKEGMLRELARVMRETSTCELGRDAPRPVTTAMDGFGAEFAAHAQGRCPTGACDR